MPVAKHLSYARSPSRTEQSRRIDGRSFAHTRALPQQTSSPRPVIAAVSLASRSILGTAAKCAESASDILLAVASWMLRKIVTGCLAYAIAMYGIPAAALRGESGEPEPFAPPVPPRNPSGLHAILADMEEDISADEILSSPNAAQGAARSEPTPGARSGWCAAIIAPAALLVSKIREGSARRRMVAELRNLDDRSLRDIGISRADLGQIARYGVRPE